MHLFWVQLESGHATKILAVDVIHAKKKVETAMRSAGIPHRVTGVQLATPAVVQRLRNVS